MPNWWDDFAHSVIQPSPSGQSSAPPLPTPALPAGPGGSSIAGPMKGYTVGPSGDYQANFEAPPTPLNSDAERNLILFNELGRGSASVIQNTPQYQAAIKSAQETAADNANLRKSQLSGKQLLDMMDELGRQMYRAGPDVLSAATGPNELQGIGDWNPQKWWNNDLSSEGYQARRYANESDPEKKELYGRALALNGELHHMVNAIGALAKNTGGGRQGGTDQSQQVILNMVDEILHNPDNEAKFRILNVARNAARGLSGYQQVPVPDVNTPHGFELQQYGKPEVFPRKTFYDKQGKPVDFELHNGQWVRAQ
jgi:hypothetical protein